MEQRRARTTLLIFMFQALPNGQSYTSGSNLSVALTKATVLFWSSLVSIWVSQYLFEITRALQLSLFVVIEVSVFSLNKNSCVIE